MSRRPLLSWILSDRRLNTVQGKLAGLFAIVIGGVAIFIYLFFPAKLERQAIGALAAKAESVGAMAAFTTDAALVFDDLATMGDVLDGVLENPDVMYAEIVDRDGNVLTSRRSMRTDVFIPKRSQAATALSADRSSYEVYAPIRFNRQQIGHVYIAFSTERVREEIRDLQYLVKLVSALIFCTGLLAILVVSRVVTGSLRRIADTAQQVANGQLSRRASVPSRDEVGQLARSFNTMIDRLESAQNEMELVNAQLTQILDSLPAQVGVLDLDLQYLYVNPAGIPDAVARDRVIGKGPEDYWAARGVDSDVGARTREALRRCLVERQMLTHEETLWTADGDERHLICVYSPMFDTAGEVTRAVHYFVDITEKWLAEKALFEKEEQLVHAQKMEALGRLAGGVAHDFNNLLSAIVGHAELVLMDLEDDHAARSDIEEIRQTVGRASRLTRQLLALSRKQVMAPRILDLNEVVRGVEKMLGRLIGEDVQFEARCGDDLGKVRADPGQVEQVIMNLVVNARDAMPTGGSLVIKTANVGEKSSNRVADLRPGAYVLLSVSDTGVGMDESTRARIFEPFFTTKALGEGTGLGLATVYGIVKQSGGHVTVASKPGVGSTFKVYLPCVTCEEIMAESEDCTDVPLAGDETVLLVEDDDGLMQLARRSLERFGYSVLTANNPLSALSIACSHDGPIHLVVSDVVMPGMSGPDLIERMAPHRPEARVLFMSGYPGTTADCQRVLDSGFAFLQKPFTPTELASKVRNILDSPAPSDLLSAAIPS